jgi:hypothetical protein
MQANTRSSAHGIGPLFRPRRCPKAKARNGGPYPMLDLTPDQMKPTPKPKIVSGAKQDWELVIGMEVHAQVSSKAKLFSGASTHLRRGAQFQRGLRRRGHARDAARHQRILRGPGRAHRAGAEGRDPPQVRLRPQELLLPRLPQGYQISQLYHPIVGEGEVLVEMGDGTRGRPHRAHPPGTGRRANRSTTWTPPCPSSTSTAPASP